MVFQEQVYSPFWFLPWTTALQTKPANSSNTDVEIQKWSKRAQYSRMVKDEVPQHSSTLVQGVDHRREGGRLPTVHLLTPPHLPAPRAAQGSREGRQLCPHTYLAQPHLSTTWGALPGPLCHSCSPGERSKSQGAESTGRHLLQQNAAKDMSPHREWRKPRCITVGKEMLGKLFDWNITVNRREN